MKSEYQRALGLTDAAAWIYIDLVDAAVDESDAYTEMRGWVNETLSKRAGSVSQLAEELADRGKSSTDPAFGGDLFLADDLRKRTTQMVAKFAEMDAARSVRANVIPELEKALFLHGYKPKIKGFKQKALIDTVNYAIGLIPVVGPFVGLKDLVLNLGTLRQQDAKAAQRHNKGLENYCRALEFWCMTATETIRRMNAAAASY